MRSGALAADRIAGVETGGCPHTAIREDASINLAAVAEMRQKFPDLDLVLIESGGDNLAATFSPELADITIYVIDVAAGDKIPSKGGPGHHALGPAGHQQDRPRAVRRRVARGDGARRQEDARRAAVRVHQSEDRQRRRDGRQLHPGQGRARRMMLTFTRHSGDKSDLITVAPDTLIVAGWTGRDEAALRHHIEELAAIGVPRPSSVPVFYRNAVSNIVQTDRLEVLGPDTSGEVEPVVVALNDGLVDRAWVGSHRPQGRDHGHRAFEATLRQGDGSGAVAA